MDFEVVYSSFSDGKIQETIVKFNGAVGKGKGNTLLLQHCINGFFKIIISKYGRVYSIKDGFLGRISEYNCLIVDTNPNQETVNKITVRGVKQLFLLP